jgi:glycosyltransferase involved in cell wall biosynthesis
MRRLRVIFVAGHSSMPDGGTGGQGTESLSLLDSPLRELVGFILLDSTMVSLPPPPLFQRAWSALRRILAFLRALPQADVALVFAADGMSLAEKGLMCILARFTGRGVVLRVSSGHIERQVRENPWLRLWLRLTIAGAHVFSTQGPHWTAFYNRFTDDRRKLVEVFNPIRLPASPSPLAFADPTRITFVGWMEPPKGIFETLEVFRRIHQEFPRTVLTLAGSGSALEEFRARVRALGLEHSVELLGWRSRNEVFDLLRRSDLFLFPSHVEGLPNAVVEAMAAGLPCVVTPVGSVPDIIQDGVTGYLAGIGDVDRMTACLRALLRDPASARRMGAAARDWVVDRFDVAQTWPVYARMLHRAAYEAQRDATVIYETIRS